MGITEVPDANGDDISICPGFGYHVHPRFVSIKKACTLYISEHVKAAADKRDVLVDLESGDKKFLLTHSYVLQWPVTYKPLRASEIVLQFSHPIFEFLTSSGTSAGERKLLPTTQDELDRKQLLYSLLMPVMNLPSGLTTPSRGPSQRGSGKKYELVITTYAGICRYRVGDILQVMGFHNSGPQFKLQSTLVMLTLKPFQDIMLFTASYLLRTQTMLFGYGRMFELGLSTVSSCGQLNWST
ncbi:hypothetical protein RDI58_004468 [Solanum bulbocastanum]|uniref:GH3 middle domain-containing protein n=1 Tax=Solanum bulbocastanum TaxID=147425 RepID=A0AAN8YLM9_SOLBU